LLRLISEDLETVSCFGTGIRLTGNPEEHDFMTAQFRTASGVVARIMTSFVNESPTHHHYRIFTTRGVFERTRPQANSNTPSAGELPRALFYSAKGTAHSGEFSDLAMAEMPPRYAENPNATGHGGVDYAMLDAFFHAIRTGKPAPVALREGLRISVPGIYAAESARRGGEVLKIQYP